ncbi:MAG: SusE domain-containing protein [Dysgonamonadaceae bacterium]|nr:SusE domain-containing protein [Dysgonamonadaceae bacterium]
MKSIIIKLTVIASFIVAFVSCSSNGEVRELGVSAVKNLYEPDNGKAIVLQSSASAALYFEWEPAMAEDGGMVLYEVAFDKTDGDFSNPVFVMASENNGASNYANITHKQLNKIAAMMGVESAKQGTFKWTVFSSKGINPVKAGQERTLTITRLAGFADIPAKVYVTGEASEAGTDISSALEMKSTAEGEFEIYTRLTAGKTYQFASANTGTPRTFYTEGGVLKETGTSTVATTGVYRITLDFTTSVSTYTLVTRIGFYFCPDGAILFDLDYIGNGVWKASSKPITFKQESWGRDERYKFRMFVKENGGADPEKELEWATLIGTDSRPTQESPESYYYLKLLTELSQWDNKWKMIGEMDNALVDFTVYLQADKPYTHSVVKVGDQ